MTGTASGDGPEPGDRRQHVDQLQHLDRRLFGFTRGTAWQAHDRLAAIVVGALGWSAVQPQSPEGRPAPNWQHRLDVVARHPSGAQRRLIVQCKEWGETVVQHDVEALAGVRKDIGSVHLAIASTSGFTSAARHAAVAEDVAMVAVRPCTDTSERATFVRVIDVTMNVLAPPVVTNLRVGLGATYGHLPGGSFEASTFQVLERHDGTPAESLAELMGRKRAIEAGEFDHRLELPEARWLRVPGGRVQIHAVDWHEKVEQDSHSREVEAKGEPKVVVQELDTARRLVVDQHLYAWVVDAEDNIVWSGRLDRPASGAAGSPDRGA